MLSEDKLDGAILHVGDMETKHFYLFVAWSNQN